MKIGIPRESLSGETRVACTPATVALLSKLGFETVVESGAGLAASLDDAAYQTAGATVADKATVWACPLIYKVNAPSEGELPLLKEGQTIVSFLWPRQNEALVEALRAKKVNALAMDMVPRISRAQALDALSSMANISGYRAVIEAANAFGRFFTGQITAAGKVPPAQVLVIGAGVAGLAAIGTANSLGAVVRAFDTRLEVAEQIESMGGKFLKLDFPQESGGSGDGYAKVMSDEFIAAEMKLCRAGERGGHHHHHRRHSGQTRAQADYQRNGGKHEIRLRHRRFGGGDGRQLRTHQTGRIVRNRQRRENHRLHRHGKPPCRTVFPALRHQLGEPDQAVKPEQRR